MKVNMQTFFENSISLISTLSMKFSRPSPNVSFRFRRKASSSCTIWRKIVNNRSVDEREKYRLNVYIEMLN